VSPRGQERTARRRGTSSQRSAGSARTAATPVEAPVEDGALSPRRGAKKTMMHYIRQLPN